MKTDLVFCRRTSVETQHGKLLKVCVDLILARREDLLSSMLPVYRELLQHDLNILVYSGDVDAIVPVRSSSRNFHAISMFL